MLKLFKLENFEVIVEPETFLLKPFADLLKKNKNNETKTKTDLAFIYFYSDPRSDYQYIIDKSERIKSIKEGLGLDSTWKPNEVINKAIEFYESFKPMTALLLEDSYAAVNKLREFLRNIDLNEKDEKGKPLYSPNQITSTIKLIPSLVKDLKEAEKALNSELTQNVKMRGGQSKTIFDDGINL